MHRQSLHNKVARTARLRDDIATKPYSAVYWRNRTLRRFQLLQSRPNGIHNVAFISGTEPEESVVKAINAHMCVRQKGQTTAYNGSSQLETEIPQRLVHVRLSFHLF